MQELKDRIVHEGKVLPGNIIKVDGFLNHRIDTQLMNHIAEEFGKHFNMDEVTMILTAEAFLKKNPNPTRDEVKLAISGNLCRCTGYAKINDAVLLAAARMRGEEAEA